jgi:hypothetical protein
MVYQRADNLQRVDIFVKFSYKRQRKSQQQDDKIPLAAARTRWLFFKDTAEPSKSQQQDGVQLIRPVA